MTLRNRGGLWHYRFKLDGKEYKILNSDDILAVLD